MPPIFSSNSEQGLADRLRSPVLIRALRDAAVRTESAVHLAAREHGVQMWLPLPPAGAFADGFRIGSSCDGRPVSVCQKQLAGPLTVVVGPPASGKSTLIERLVKQLDASGLTAQCIALKPGEASASRFTIPDLPIGRAGFSLQPPPGVPFGEWLAAYCRLIEQNVYLHSGTRFVIEVVDSIGEDGLCLARVLHGLKARAAKARTWKSSNQLESACNGLDRLSTGHTLFSMSSQFPWQYRLGRSHSLSLAGLPPEATRLASLLIPEAWCRWAAVQGWTDRTPRFAFIIDDARLVAKPVSRGSSASVDALTNLIDLGHAYGLMMILAVQSTQELDPALLATARNLILIGPQTAEDLRMLQTRLALDRDRTSYLLTQPRFRATCHLRASEHPFAFPVVLASPDDLPSPTEATRIRLQRQAGLLEGWTPKVWKPEHSEDQSSRESKATQQNALDPKDHALLSTFAYRPYLLQTEAARISPIRVTGRELTASRERLEQRGLVMTVQLSRYTLWQLQEQACRKIGVQPVPLAGRGSFEHRWLQARARAWLSPDHVRTELERDLGHGPVDVWGQRATGDITAFEIVLDLATLDAIPRRLRGFTGRLIVVVPDRSAAAKATTALADTLHDTIAATKDIWTLKHFIERTKAIAS
ncbi:MAG: hypothetical protein AAFZ67_11350 [Planctomycetota bacterium]